MPKFTLDEMRKSAEHKNEVLEVETGTGSAVVLLPYLRMSKENRRAWDKRFTGTRTVEEDAQEVVDETTEDGDALLDYHRSLYRIVARSDRDYDELVTLIGDDAALSQEILMAYLTMGATPGEAKPSLS